MIDDAVEFLLDMFILAVFIIAFYLLIDGYIAPLMKYSYLTAPTTKGISYTTYTSILSRIEEGFDIIAMILLGGPFAYFILRKLFKQEEEDYLVEEYEEAE